MAQAAQEGIKNFSLLVCHVLVPPAIQTLLSAADNQVQGFLAAGHVCTITGYAEYEPIARHYRVPIVVTGFEPLDLLQGIYLCIRQLETGRREVENQYSRSVRRDGNRSAQGAMRRIFVVRPQHWRGIGEIAASGLGLAHTTNATTRCYGSVQQPPLANIRANVSPGKFAWTEETVRLPRLRHTLHAGTPTRCHDGILRRGLCRLLPLPPAARRMTERTASPHLPDARSGKRADRDRAWRRRIIDAPAH